VYFSWKRFTARKVAVPYFAVSLPGDPGPLSAIWVSGSLLRSFCSCMTSVWTSAGRRRMLREKREQ
jgi:hypothetical protein